jgi:2-polyprenyl-6-methoxyphenol hydroxylase-like FAD-dependent oxidoreductase
VKIEHGGAYDMLWFKAPPPADVDPDFGYQFLQRHGTAFAHPHPDGVHQYGWAFGKGRYPELRRDGPGAWLEAMCHHVPDTFATHLRAIGDDVDAAFFKIVSYHLADWYVPGLLLIGDAAHPMSAVGGQGINMALRDAVVVANRLGPLLRDGAKDTAAIDVAARAVVAERVPEIDRIQTLQERGSKILNLETRLAQLMMERVLPMLGKRAAPLLARGVGTTREFNVGVTDVALAF